jgi:hypothetical protein
MTDHNTMLQKCLIDIASLTKWEQEFITKLADMPNLQRLSEGQAKKLEEIWASRSAATKPKPKQPAGPGRGAGKRSGNYRPRPGNYGRPDPH